jgi:hypothetical protein
VPQHRISGVFFARGVSPCQKWWWSLLEREISCSQWEGPSMHSRCLVFFPFMFWGGGRNFFFFHFSQLPNVFVYNTNGFETETMYDYYIVLKSMFLVTKLFSHPSIVYASFTILLPWTKLKQHQNHSKSKVFQKSKLQFQQTLHSYHNFVQGEVFFKVTNTLLYTNQKKTNWEIF